MATSRDRLPTCVTLSLARAVVPPNRAEHARGLAGLTDRDRLDEQRRDVPDVLETTPIKSYTQQGPSRVGDGLLPLRSDLQRLRGRGRTGGSWSITDARSTDPSAAQGTPRPLANHSWSSQRVGDARRAALAPDVIKRSTAAPPWPPT